MARCRSSISRSRSYGAPPDWPWWLWLLFMLVCTTAGKQRAGKSQPHRWKSMNIASLGTKRWRYGLACDWRGSKARLLLLLLRFSGSRQRRAQEGLVARSQRREIRTHSLRGAQLGQRISTWRSGSPCRMTNSNNKSAAKKSWRCGGGGQNDAEPGKLARMEGDQDQICRGHYTSLIAECSASRVDKPLYQSDAESATGAVAEVRLQWWTHRWYSVRVRTWYLSSHPSSEVSLPWLLLAATGCPSRVVARCAGCCG